MTSNKSINSGTSGTSDTIIVIPITSQDNDDRENIYELSNIINERIYENHHNNNNNNSINSVVTLYNYRRREDSSHDNFSLYVQRAILYFGFVSSLLVLILGVLYVLDISIFRNLALGVILIGISLSGIVFLLSSCLMFIIISIFSCYCCEYS